MHTELVRTEVWTALQRQQDADKERGGGGQMLV